MAVHTKDFNFRMPIVKTVTLQDVRKIVAVGKSAAQPTKALKQLMSGKSVSSAKR